MGLVTHDHNFSGIEMESNQRARLEDAAGNVV